MDKKWSEKTTLQKVMDIISGIALFVWLLFELLERTGKIAYADMVTYVAVLVICACETVSFWNVKRSLSYVAIAGVVLMVATIALQISLL